MNRPPLANDRLIRLSRAMVWVTTVGIVLVVVLSALGAFIPEWTRNIVLVKLGQAGAALPITPLGRALTAAVLVVPIGVMVHGLLAVRRMFRAFGQGEVLAPGPTRDLQIFAATVLAQAPLGPLTSAALSVVLTIGNPPGERAFMIAFSISDYFVLIVGGVLFAAASVMREAARIADENASFV
jgi:MFS-type transporter involved in bile tolerance (Atg22 family)